MQLNVIIYKMIMIILFTIIKQIQYKMKLTNVNNESPNSLS